MWMLCSFSFTATSAAPCTLGMGRPSGPWLYFSSQKASLSLTVGISTKLYSGGGEEMDHSSVRASHGLSLIHISEPTRPY